MQYIGAFEAKNRLSELLTLVENGQEVTITKHGRPVARLVAAEDIQRSEVLKAIEAIKKLPRMPLDAEELHELLNNK
jgi:prevent-host-death family protein